jgi:hypothetical protein
MHSLNLTGRCAGVRYATGSSQCWNVPVWEVSDPDRQIAGRRLLACHKHVAGLLNRDGASLVVPVGGTS